MPGVEVIVNCLCPNFPILKHLNIIPLILKTETSNERVKGTFIVHKIVPDKFCLDSLTVMSDLVIIEAEKNYSIIS